LKRSECIINSLEPNFILLTALSGTKTMLIALKRDLAIRQQPTGLWNVMSTALKITNVRHVNSPVEKTDKLTALRTMLNQHVNSLHQQPSSTEANRL
jgi:hypothetical protein